MQIKKISLMVSLSENICCHLCSSLALQILTPFSSLKRVTSDCQPWPSRGSLAQCSDCGLVQKVIDKKWQEEIKIIYQQYQIYHQAKGAEQVVFDNVSGAALSRSQSLVEKLREEVNIPENGSLLDVGCGNGAFLQAFSNVCPNWILTGSELDDKNKAAIEAIPTVQKLHVGELDNLEEQFDIISFIHVLEHIPSPASLLKSLHKKFTPNGVLLIQVPYFADNPFDLLIADHCSHFTPKTLSKTLEAAGYTISLLRTDIVTKEITLVANPNKTEEIFTFSSSVHREDAMNSLKWLQGVQEIASSSQEVARSQGRPFGIFGTSIGGIWLFSSLKYPADFFVDEDKNRIGSKLYGVPILSPSEIPEGATVCIPLAPSVAEKINKKFKDLSIKFTIFQNLKN